MPILFPGRRRICRDSKQRRLQSSSLPTLHLFSGPRIKSQETSGQRRREEGIEYGCQASLRAEAGAPKRKTQKETEKLQMWLYSLIPVVSRPLRLGHLTGSNGIGWVKKQGGGCSGSMGDFCDFCGVPTICPRLVQEGLARASSWLASTSRPRRPICQESRWVAMILRLL